MKHKMKHILLSVFLVVLLPCCKAFEGYSPMLSIGFEIGGSKINVGIAPLPTFQKTEPQPVELPAIEVSSK
jgi:hypothetical protein